MSKSRGGQSASTPIPKHYIPPRYGDLDMEDVNMLAADAFKQAALANKALESHALVTKELIETKQKLEAVEKENKLLKQEIKLIKQEYSNAKPLNGEVKVGEIVHAV